MQSLQDQTQCSPLERVAYVSDIKFVDLGGNIGVISNGAAACMATCDYIAHLGGQACNFSDMGGLTYHEQIFDIVNLFEDCARTKVILINCFGGMLNVDKVSGLLVDMVNKKILTKPIVVRLKGTN